MRACLTGQLSILSLVHPSGQLPSLFARRNLEVARKIESQAGGSSGEKTDSMGGFFRSSFDPRHLDDG
jgi:hypothetical protein